MLIQESDHEIDQIPDFKVVTKVQPTEQQLKALQFGQHVVKHVKSNAVVVTTDTKTLGVGMGQPNRIDSAKIAIKKKQCQRMVTKMPSWPRMPSSQWMTVWNMRLNMISRQLSNQVAASRIRTRLQWRISSALRW